MSRLSDWQRGILGSGQYAMFAISASEWANPELHDLIEKGLYEYWRGSPLPMGQTTEAGRAALEEPRDD